jgi:hypothetical protein
MRTGAVWQKGRGKASKQQLFEKSCTKNFYNTGTGVVARWCAASEYMAKHSKGKQP